MSDPDKHDETAYLLSSKANRDLLPLDEAIEDIVTHDKPLLDRLADENQN